MRHLLTGIRKAIWVICISGIQQHAISAFVLPRKGCRPSTVNQRIQSTLTDETIDSDTVAMTSPLQPTTQPSTTNERNDLEIIPPNGSFPATKVGDISIASMNVLAPSYHSIDQPEETREQYAEMDRQNRYVKAIAMAKKTNADVLCLQEVEGGNPELNELLGSCLEKDEHDNGAENNDEMMRGYDGFVFSPLLPNRKQDIVGLCVAWRTDRHRLVSCETFRRGMVVQLAEQSTGATVAIANLHLPAKPSAVEGRLRAMASAIRRIQTCEATSSKRKRSALDGLAVVVGDFNCGHNSPAVKLLKTGYSTYGTLRDRNYKAKISKRAASSMRHVFRFQDVYDGDLRYSIAPVTVSLHGRGPGSMDHILYSASGDSRKKTVRSSSTQTVVLTGRRQARRDRGNNRRSIADIPNVREENSRLRISSVLSTVDANDLERLKLIEDGLPNESAEFYSDHMPVGALFASQVIETSVDNAKPKPSYHQQQLIGKGRDGVNQRRQNYSKSVALRRRHNKVLRCIAEWLLEHGATDMIRDVPLYKWKWLTGNSSDGTTRLTKKMRAPDLCCVLENTLLIIEVTVSQKDPDEMYQMKVGKYQDVIGALENADAVKNAGIQVSSASLMAIVLNAEGQLCEASRNDIKTIVELIPDFSSDAEIHVEELLSSFQDAIL